MPLNLIVGWAGMAACAISGALVGLFFHKDDWMGGYDAFGRRMVRLGHISFFGMGVMNILFAVSVRDLPAPAAYVQPASLAFVAAAVSMPICCFLTAWHKSWRHLFPIPVIATFAGVGLLLTGWIRS